MGICKRFKEDGQKYQPLIIKLSEQFSTVRHSLGFYRCVANTARYTLPSSQSDIPSILEAAVAKVALQHPPLLCGVINEERNDPSFICLASIDLSICIEYRNLDFSTEEEYEQGLIEIIENQHRQLWPDLHCRPGWKVIIVQNAEAPSGKEKDIVQFDLLFAFHHAFADGLSGMVFHRSFLSALNTPSLSPVPELTDHILSVPKSTVLKPAVEKIIDFRVSWTFFFSAIWKEFRPKWLFSPPSPPWTANLCSPLPVQNYRSRVKLITLPAKLVSSILAACREQKATITGLLHGDP